MDSSHWLGYEKFKLKGDVEDSEAGQVEIVDRCRPILRGRRWPFMDQGFVFEFSYIYIYIIKQGWRTRHATEDI
jgi:hypothetical protein